MLRRINSKAKFGVTSVALSPDNTQLLTVSYVCYYAQRASSINAQACTHAAMPQTNRHHHHHPQYAPQAVGRHVSRARGQMCGAHNGRDLRCLLRLRGKLQIRMSLSVAFSGLRPELRACAALLCVVRRGSLCQPLGLSTNHRTQRQEEEQKEEEQKTKRDFLNISQVHLGLGDPHELCLPHSHSLVSADV